MEEDKYETSLYKGVRVLMDKDDDEIDLVEVFIDKLIYENRSNLSKLKKINSDLFLEWKHNIPGEYAEGRSIQINYNHPKVNLKCSIYIKKSEKIQG